MHSLYNVGENKSLVRFSQGCSAKQLYTVLSGITTAKSVLLETLVQDTTQ